VTLLVAVVVGSAAAYWPEPAATLDLYAVSAADKGDWAEALDRSTQAVTDDPRLPPYQLVRGLAAANLGDLETARDAFSLATADDLPASWIDLAAVQVRLGDDTGARESLDRAIRLGVQQPAIAVAAADLYRQLDLPDLARAQLAAAFALFPSLAADPSWQQPDWQSIADSAVTDALAAADPWQAMLLALETGRFDAARTILSSLAPADRDLGSTVVDAWTGDQPAFDRLHAAALADPLDATKTALCRRVARVHDPSAVAPGWTCDGPLWEGSYAVGRTGAGDDAVPIPGPDAFWQGAYAYRRPGPLDSLVPWVLHIHAEDT
jgi:tetratricopeptide (TPR) repeat protein